MKLKNFLKSGTFFLSAFLCIQPVCSAFYYAGHLADSYYVKHGEALQVSHCVAEVPELHCTSSPAQLKLFGIFPVKEVSLQPAEEIVLVPCGQPFGIRMLMDGVMVIGFGEVQAKSGDCCPAVSAGIQEGDIITEVNHELLHSAQDFRDLVADSEGTTLHLTVRREDTLQEVALKPEYSFTAQCWQTGIWVRDSTAGIGTMTYYDPSDGAFGGLGQKSSLEL